MLRAGIDYETYYEDPGDCSVKILGPWGYTKHPRFDAYLVSIYCKEFQYMGHPKDFDWSKLDGYEMISHNCGFEMAVTEHLNEKGIINFKPTKWIDSSHLAAYTCGLRSLKNAAKYMLNIELDKQIRKELAGMTWADIQDNDQKVLDLLEKADRTKSEKVATACRNRAARIPNTKRVTEYCLRDSRLAYDLVERYYDAWPEIERKISTLMIKQCRRGVYIDRPLLDKSIIRLRRLKQIAYDSLPWTKEGLPPLSDEAIGEYCLTVGLVKPKSLAKSDLEAEKWIKANFKHKWVRRIRSYRRINALLSKLENMVPRIEPSGRMSYEQAYFGAHTGRTAGSKQEEGESSGWNPQNLHKKMLYWLKPRNLICAPPGRKLFGPDLSQIEARITQVLAKNMDVLSLISQGMSIYEAHARTTMGWTGGKLSVEDPKKYALAKARVLALGFGCGWKKLITMVKQYGLDADVIFDLEYDEEEEAGFIDYISKYDKVSHKEWETITDHKKRVWVTSWKVVMSFRNSNKRIGNLWKHLTERIKQHLGGTYECKLPSWRSLKYRNIGERTIEVKDPKTGKMVKKKTGDYEADIPNGRYARYDRDKIYGPLLLENIVQALARDLFMLKMILLEEAGYECILQVHDQVLIELDFLLATSKIMDILRLPVDFLPGLPIEAEGKEMQYYDK